jgi:erythromycin esterase
MAQRQTKQALMETASARNGPAGEDGLRAAVLALADDYYSAIFAYLYHLLDDRDIAQEQTQETFLHAFAARRRLPNIANRRAWLYRIATDLALDHFGDGPDIVASVDRQAPIARALAALPPEARAVILLHDHCGFSVGETAQVLGVREGVLRARLNQARSLLYALYERKEADDERIRVDLAQLPDSWPTPGAEAALRGWLTHPETLAARPHPHRRGSRLVARYLPVLAALLIVAGLAMIAGSLVSEARRNVITARPHAATTPPSTAMPTPSPIPDNSGIPPEALAWLRAGAIPLSSTQPTDPLTDLTPLRPIVGGARLIVLGEGTHGTREFVTLKHRLIRYLVQEMGVRTLLMPMDWPNADQINAYLLSGRGDPSRYLNGADASLGNTQEVLDLLYWLRTYNAGAGPEAQVMLQSVGVMEVYSHFAADRVTVYLNEVDPIAAARIVRPNQALYDNMLARRGEYEARSSRAEFISALHAVRALLQYDALSAAMSTSDRAALAHKLALDNVATLLEEGGPGDRVALWTDNIGADYLSPDSWAAMLHDRLDRQMISIGFAFYQGPFNAYVWRTSEQPGTLMAVQAEPAPVGTIEDYLNRAGPSRLLLDLRPARAASDTAWLRQQHYMRGTVLFYDPCFPEQHYAAVRLPDAYDALIFVRDTSFATLLAKPVPATADYGPCQAAPLNLDFMEGLKDWSRLGVAADQYATGIDIGRAPGSQFSASIRSTSATTQGSGMLSQQFQAIRYRGQRVRLSASVRGQGLTGEASLWLRVDAPFRVNVLGRQPIPNSDAWQTREIVLDVPEDAKTIGFGAGMQGAGMIEVLNVHFETVSAATPLQGQRMELQP